MNVAATARAKPAKKKARRKRLGNPVPTLDSNPSHYARGDGSGWLIIVVRASTASAVVGTQYKFDNAANRDAAWQTLKNSAIASKRNFNDLSPKDDRLFWLDSN
jgi:hypothetical protein